MSSLSHHEIDKSATASDSLHASNGASPSAPTPPPDEVKSTQLSSTTEQNVTTTTDHAPPPTLSKNALKRQRKQQAWEEGKDDRRKRRKQKRISRRERQREERAASGLPAPPRKQQPATLVPVALILDCDFEQYMTDKERVSLSIQVTRCYSDNRHASFRVHLWLAGWRGRLRERFASVLGDQQKHWTGIGFVEGDFLTCAKQAREQMRQRPGRVTESLQRSLDVPTSWERAVRDPFPLAEPAPPLDEAFADVVYLTSESPYTLQRLEPHTNYIIGGLVDKNREKGLCYRRAVERGIRTARLPIGDFMVMQSRQVLATNHVVEIMLKWLECEDWGKAFLEVIPKRKGGKLIATNGSVEGVGGQQSEGQDEEEEADGEDPVVAGESEGDTADDVPNEDQGSVKEEIQ